MYARPQMMRLMYGSGGYNAESYGEGLVGGYMPKPQGYSTTKRNQNAVYKKKMDEGDSKGVPESYIKGYNTYQEHKGTLKAYQDAIYSAKERFANNYLAENKIEPTKKMVVEQGKLAQAQWRATHPKVGKKGFTAAARAQLSEEEKVREAALRAKENAIRKERMNVLKKKV